MKYIFFLFVFAVLIMMINCEDETLKPKEYPYLATLPVENLDSTGVTLKARILDYGQEPITDFGFILINSYNESRYSLTNITSTSEFVLRMFTDIVKNQVYTVRAFIKTETYEVLGNQVSFVGQGSLSPEIYTFSPDSGIDGTIVTITGNYFNINKDKNIVKIGSQSAEVLSADYTELVIKTPTSNYSGKYKISITINNQTSVSRKDFIILGPEVYSVEPENARPGDIISIKGIRLFNEAEGAHVFFDEFEAEMVSASENQLVFRVPPYPKNFTSIRLICGHKVLEIPYIVNISQNFSELNTADFQDGNPLPAFSTLSAGFVFDFDKIWEYYPVSDSWVTISQYPGQGRYNMFFFTIGNKAYMGGGSYYDYHYDFWEFDLELNKWEQLSDIPATTSGSCGFALNGKGYVLGGTLGSNILSFWQYNPVNDSWTQLPNVPEGDFYNIWGVSSFFVLNNKPYLNIKGVQNNFFEFSDMNKTWTKRADCPLQYNGYTFTINNRGYIGSTFWGQLFEYNPEDDLWVEKLPYPGCTGLGYYFGFAINNTGYIGVNESENHSCPTTFYSFTP